MQVWGLSPFLFVPDTAYIMEGLFHSLGNYVRACARGVSDRFGQPNCVNLRDYDDEAAYSLKI
jgi:hypothetical protein